MAIKPSANIADTNNPTAAYPEGSARDDSGPFTEDGTPVLEYWLNDIWGFFQSILVEGGVSPNGNPDSLNNQQYLNALKNAFVRQVEPALVTLTNNIPLLLTSNNGRILFNGADDASAEARIGTNDGAADLGLRYGHKYTGGQAVHIGDNGAVAVEMVGEAQDGLLRIKVADEGLDGDPVVWDTTIFINGTEARFENLVSDTLRVDGFAEVDSLEVTDQFAVSLSSGSAALLMDGPGGNDSLKRITCNDGGGNFNIRAGCFRSGNEERRTNSDGNSGACLMSMNQEGNTGSINLAVATQGGNLSLIPSYIQTLALNVSGLNLNGSPIDGRFNTNANGNYILLPGGWKIMWGKQFRDDDPQTQPFPTAFTVLSTVVVNATPDQSGINKKEVSSMLNGVTTTGFNYQVRDVDGNNATFEDSTINWMAFGQ